MNRHTSYELQVCQPSHISIIILSICVLLQVQKQLYHVGVCIEHLLLTKLTRVETWRRSTVILCWTIRCCYWVRHKCWTIINVQSITTLNQAYMMYSGIYSLLAVRPGQLDCGGIRGSGIGPNQTGLFHRRVGDMMQFWQILNIYDTCDAYNERNVSL